MTVALPVLNKNAASDEKRHTENAARELPDSVEKHGPEDVEEFPYVVEKRQPGSEEPQDFTTLWR